MALPRLGLGASALAGLYAPVAEAQAQSTIAAAWDAGVRLFDTAPLYGLGASESRLGRALAARPRSDFVISTKVGRLLTPAPVFDFSREAAFRSLRASLERLELEAADLVLIHDPDDHIDEAVEGSLAALSELRAAGRIRWLGVGSNRIDTHLRFAETGAVDCLLVAGRYTVLEHGRALNELLPLCADRRVAVLIGGVFNSGILASPEGSGHYDYREAPAAIRARVARLHAVCDRHRVPLKAAALQFPLAHPAVTSLLLGAGSPEELAECMALLALPIPSALWDDLREERLIDRDCPAPAVTR